MSSGNNLELKKRLTQIWKSPDFSLFFEKFSKKSAYLVKKGSILFNEGDQLSGLYFIKKGFVKLFRTSDEGRESTIYLYGPSSILGVRALTSEDECAKHYAEAITDLEVIKISRGDYWEIVSENPEYLIDLLHVFINRLNYTERKLEGFILADVTARLAYFLADCAQRFGQKEDGKIALPLTLTHQRIAEFIGSYRETVTVAVEKLEKEKVLSIQRGKVLVLNYQKLKKFAKRE